MMRLYLFTSSPMSFGTLLHCRPRLPCTLLKTYCDYKQLENTTPGGFICKIPGNNLLIPSSILITTQRTNQGDLNVLRSVAVQERIDFSAVFCSVLRLINREI